MMTSIDFIHPELNVEIDSISGHCVYIKEGRLAIDDREVLYLVGYALVDTSCCGPGGCGFALVAGFVIKWRYTTSTEGRPVSHIELIQDKSVQESIERRLKSTEMVTQVIFRR